MMNLIANLHPSVVIGVTVLAAAYLCAAYFGRHKVSPRQWFWFVVAIAALMFTLGPVDEWAERRVFFMHMFEHLMQSLVIPPLILLAVPGWMLRPLVLARGIEPLARRLTNPIVAFLLFAAVFVIAHDPPVFDLMCRDQGFHIAVHLAFMVSGTLLWWPVLSRVAEMPRLSYPLQILYLFLLMIPMTAVAAPITLANEVLFPWYVEGTHPWGLTPMADQILGGLLMWIGQGTYLMCVSTVSFYRWARREDEDIPALEVELPKVRFLSAERGSGPIRA